MTYRNQLSPWCIVCFLPNLQRTIVARLRRRSEAEEYLQRLKRRYPDLAFQIVYEPPDQEPLN